ncbi:MAG: hypothetical protein Tsb0013_19710 [Phycisphaerales bacterium]
MSRVILETANGIALGLWAGVLAFVGVAAAIAFPMMKTLDPTLPAYAAYEGGHWRIAAGQVMNRLFNIADDIGFVTIVVSLIALAVLMSGGRLARTRLAPVRMALWVLIAGVSVYITAGPRTEMNALAEQHWAHARAGDNQLAEEAREAFDAQHHTASALHAAQFSLVLLALGVNIAGAALGPRADEA